VLLRDLALDDHVVVRFAAGASPWDSDGDGLSDAAEAQQTGSDPRSADTDGDGRSDGEEARDGTDPRNAYSYQQIFTYQQGVAGYAGAEDVYLNTGGQTDNFGARDGLYHWAGVPILMRFNALTNIPGSLAVSGARICLTSTKNYSSTNWVSVSPMLRNWVVGTGNASADPDNGATYLQDGFGSAWSVPGASGAGTDHGPNMAAAQRVEVNTGTADPHWFPVDSALAQRWIDTPASNFGVRFEAQFGPTKYMRFSSSESATNRPLLEITARRKPRRGFLTVLR